MPDTLPQPNTSSGSGPYSTPRQLQLVGALEEAFFSVVGKGVLEGGRIQDNGGLSIVIEAASRFFSKGYVFTLPAAAQFTAASSQSLSKADNATLSIGDQPIDLGCWVYLDSLPTAGNQMALMGKWQSADLEYVLVVDNTAGTIRFKFSIRDTANTTTTTVTATTFGAPSTATWYWVHCRHSSADDRIEIGVNNGTRNTAATTGGVRDGTAAFHFGQHTGGSFLNGRVDGAFLARGALLSTSNLAALYNSGSGVSYGDLSSTLQNLLTSWWDLDERSTGAAAVTREDARGSNDLTDNNLVTSAVGKAGSAVYNGCADNATNTVWGKVTRTAASQATLTELDDYALTITSNETGVAPDEDYFRLGTVVTLSADIVTINNAVADKFLRLTDPLMQGKTTIGAGESAYVPAGESRVVFGPLIVNGLLGVDGRILVL